MECFNCGNPLKQKGKDTWGCGYSGCELHKLPMNPRTPFWKRNKNNSYRHHLIEFTKAAMSGETMHPVDRAKNILSELGIEESKE